MCDEDYNLLFLLLFLASEWMALASQSAFLDALPPLTGSALTNLITTMAMGRHEAIPSHLRTQPKRNLCGWVPFESWVNNAC